MRRFQSCSPTRTRRAWCSTKRTCSPGTSIPATTASKAARGSITALSTPPISPTAATPTSSAASSIQLAGQNSYTIADAANTGLESGLDKRDSNYVVGETIAPFSSNFSLTSKQQFDNSDFALKRLDVIANASYGGFTTSIDYGRYAAQPELGYIFAREGLQTSASYKLDKSWTVDGSVLFDMSRHYYDQFGQSTPRLYVPNYAFG